MSEKSDRAVALAHAALVKRAIAMIREHGDAVCLGHNRASELSPSDEDAITIEFSGDTGTLHYTADGYDNAYAASFSFDARCLWSRRADLRTDIRKAMEITARIESEDAGQP